MDYWDKRRKLEKEFERILEEIGENDGLHGIYPSHEMTGLEESVAEYYHEGYSKGEKIRKIRESEQ